MKRPAFTVRDFYTRCPRCGVAFDMRDLEQVREHLHGSRYQADRVRKKAARRNGKDATPSGGDDAD
jgi:uncharacterized C2H2 Zn-finger protein